MSIKKQIEAEAKKFADSWKITGIQKFGYREQELGPGTIKEIIYRLEKAFMGGAESRDRWWAERWMRQVDHYVMNTVHSEEKMKLSQEMTAAARGVLG